MPSSHCQLVDGVADWYQFQNGSTQTYAADGPRVRVDAVPSVVSSDLALSSHRATVQDRCC